MERGEIIAAVLGIGVGLLLGWFVWRFRSLSRDGISRLEGRLETTERRLARSEAQRSDGEMERSELEARLIEERRALDDIVANGGVLPADNETEPLFGARACEQPDQSATASIPAVPPALVGKAPEEIAIDDPSVLSVTGLAILTDDSARVDELAARLVQSQLWLEESEERAASLTLELEAERAQSLEARETAEAASTRLSLTKEALVAADVEVRELTDRVSEHEAILSGTKRSIGLVQLEAQRASDTANGIIDLRTSHDGSELAPSASLLASKQAEVADLRSKVESLDAGVDVRSQASQARLTELEAELAAAQAALDAVGDAPERAAQLKDEVARLRALVADHSLDRDRLGNQLVQRDQIDNKLDALFVEIHELRGRSAALREGGSNTAG